MIGVAKEVAEIGNSTPGRINGIAEVLRNMA